MLRYRPKAWVHCKQANFVARTGTAHVKMCRFLIK